MFDFLTSPYLILFARLCLGGVLIVSAIGKLLESRGTREALASQVPFLPPAIGRPAALALPWIEGAVGVLLVLGLGLWPAALVAGALMLLFTVVVTRDVVQNRRTPCSCFGRFSSENVSEWSVIRDLFLLVLAGLVIITPSRYLALDALWQGAPSGVPTAGDAVPVVLLAALAVGAIVLGGTMIATVRGFLRAF
jgi:uncharacterized membrane protein YphA (DoxX/SURF4 family)